MRARVCAAVISIVGLAGLASLAACTTADVKEVNRRPAILADLGGAKSQPIGLAKIVVRLSPGTVVGTVAKGGFCAPKSEVTMGSGWALNENLTTTYTRTFYDTVRNARYTVVGDPTALFEEDRGPRPRYVVGGALTAVQADYCRPNIYLPGEISAGVYNKFEWQIYDTVERKVVFKTSTEGSYKTDGPVAGGDDIATANAFEAAVSNLLADERFHYILRNGPAASTESAAGPKEPLKLAGGALKSGTIQSHMQDVRESVVTVVVPGGTALASSSMVPAMC